MLYEIKLKTSRQDDKGNMTDVKEHYIVEAESHGDAEKIGYELYPNTDADVFAVFRSDIKEIINAKDAEKPFYKATVVDICTDEFGKEKEIKYRMLVCAKDLSEATSILSDVLRQGYDMRLDALKRTKIADYIK